MRFTGRVRKFLLVGASAALVNLSVMVFFVEVLGFKTYLLKNLANVLSIEISIIFNFALSRAWTWGDVPAKKGRNLAGQCVSFHAANLIGLITRAVLFAVLESAGVYYILNMILGVGIAASMSFVLYDRIVFKRSSDEKKVLLR
jgi:dolichol-phosphate mannosyltransferase